MNTTPTAGQTFTAYFVSATYEDNNGTRCGCNTPEVIGEYHGVRYASRAEAQAIIDDDLSEDIGDVVDASTIYTVEDEGGAEELTPESFETFLTHLAETADAEVSDFDRNDAEDLGGWVNVRATLADGSTASGGWWIYAGGSPHAQGLSAADAGEMESEGWIANPYGVSDITQGNVSPSADLRGHFEILAAEDGSVDLFGVTCADAEDAIAAALAENMPGREESESAWCEDLRGQINGRVKDAGPDELLKMLGA